jgi:hypothetical protein
MFETRIELEFDSDEIDSKKIVAYLESMECEDISCNELEWCEGVYSIYASCKDGEAGKIGRYVKSNFKMVDFTKM